MPADPLDLCTVADVRSARRDTVATFDVLIQSMITDASSLIMEYAGRRIRPLDGSPSARTFEALGGPDLWIDDLSATPTGVQILDAAGDVQTTLVIADDVVAIPRNRHSWEPIDRLRLRASAPRPARGQEVVVTGLWGWPSVPGFVRRLCVDAVVEWMKSSAALTQQSPDQFEPGSPPARALPLSTRTALNSIRRLGAA